MLEAKDVKLKKLFYFVRPLVALRWMQERSFEQLPPMNLEQLLLESPLPRDITEELNALLVKKRQTREMGTGAAPQSMMRYFTGLYSDFSEQLPRRAISGATAADRFQRAQNYYNRVVGEFS